MKQLSVFLIIALISAFVLVGCEKDTQSPINDELQDEIELREMAADEGEDYLIDWGIDDGDENNMFDGYSSFSPNTTLPKILTPINNVTRFGRKINNRFARQITLTRIAPDSVLLSVTRELRGRFVIFENINSDTTDPDTLAIYRKPLRHIVKRNAIFVKRHPGDSDVSGENDRGFRRHWKLQSVSLGSGLSAPTHTIQIQEVVIYNSQGDSIVFTEPLHTFLNIPEDIPTFSPGEMVTIKVTLENLTASPFPDPNGSGATETVLLHYGVNRHHHARKRFDFVGTDPVTGFNVYEGTWQIGQQPFRVRHAIVDAIDNGTIYDNDPNAFPYNSATWSSPYRVRLTD